MLHPELLSFLRTNFGNDARHMFVSMLHPELLSFLPTVCILTSQWDLLYQCSIRSCFHFYINTKEATALLQISINAPSGAAFISTSMFSNCVREYFEVSMLHPELLSFLPNMKINEKARRELYQCSIRSCFHFYPVILKALILTAYRGHFCK